MSFAVKVDPTNPGQFFACCGLLELADRLWPGAEGWFDRGQFCVDRGTLNAVLTAARDLDFGAPEAEDETEDEADDEADGPVEPLLVTGPVSLRLDWWADKEVKTWAGTMKVGAIAVAMARAINAENLDPLNQSEIVYDPPKPNATRRSARKKREPFYFDARRCPNAHSRDVGFSPNDLKLKTEAHPAVELLCLVGLQRCLPAKTGEPRILDYFTWAEPLGPNLLPAAVSGLLPHVGAVGYRFENWYRTGQKKHKAFRSAVPHSKQGAQ